MKKYIYLAVINMARMENGGSGQAILLIFNGYRSKNRCFQALYHPFRPQNGHHKVLMALKADSLPRFF